MLYVLWRRVAGRRAWRRSLILLLILLVLACAAFFSSPAPAPTVRHHHHPHNHSNIALHDSYHRNTSFACRYHVAFSSSPDQFDIMITAIKSVYVDFETLSLVVNAMETCVYVLVLDAPEAEELRAHLLRRSDVDFTRLPIETVEFKSYLPSSLPAAVVARPGLERPHNYARFLLARLLPVQKLLYLDADVIVQHAKLLPQLIDSTLNERMSPPVAASIQSKRTSFRTHSSPRPPATAAATDLLRYQYYDDRRNRTMYVYGKYDLSSSTSVVLKRLPLFARCNQRRKRRCEHLNAGVLLLRLDRWRALELERRVFDWIRVKVENPTAFVSGSQAPLLLTLLEASRGRRLDAAALPPLAVLNGLGQRSLDRVEAFDNVRDYTILHWSGDCKPWRHQQQQQQQQQHDECLFQTLWLKYNSSNVL